MDSEVRAHIAALTGAFTDLVSVLVQREVIDRGDADGIFDVMQHALRQPESEEALQQIATWRERILALGKDSIPLPGE